MKTLSIGRTHKCFKEIKFNEDDEIILKPKAGYVSKESFIKKERRKGNKPKLALNRFIYENGIYLEKMPNVPLPLNYTQKDHSKANEKLLDLVSNNPNYITKPLKIKVKDLIEIPVEQLKKFWRYDVPLPKINNTNKLTNIQKKLAYYLGYWLGDGTSENPGSLTIDKKDQPEAKIVLKQLSKELNLKLTMGRNKKGLTCTLNKGRTCGLTTASCLDKDWLKNITTACEELEISKKNISSYQNFKNLYDPVEQYKRGNDYYYKDEKYDFNTEHIEKIKNGSKNNKRNRFKHFIKQTIKIDTPNATHVWSKMTTEEQLKYKLGLDKKDILKKYKKNMKINSVTLSEYYKIWENEGVEGLQNIINEQIESISPILLEFTKLNLIGNKHIPKIYFTAPLETRKQLLAGLIDSDGTRGKKHNYWSISQSIKHKRIIDDIEILAKSLGHFTRQTNRNSKCNGKICPSIRLDITPYHNFDIPLIYKRKKLDGNVQQLPIIIHNYKTKDIIKHIKKYPVYITHYKGKGFSIGNENTRKWSIQSKNIKHDIKLNFAIKIANCLDQKGVIEGRESEIDKIYKEWNMLLKKTNESINRENWGKNFIKKGKILGYTIKRKWRIHGTENVKFKTFKFDKSDSKFDTSKIECKTLEECKKMCYLWFDSFDSEENNIKYEKELSKLSYGV